MLDQRETRDGQRLEQLARDRSVHGPVIREGDGPGRGEGLEVGDGLAFAPTVAATTGTTGDPR